MNRLSYKLNKSHSLTTKFLLVIVLASFASAAFAEEPNIKYVDSVHQWGAWALDIEPAAGGLAPTTTNALNVRNSKITFRTNSIAALAPPPFPNTPALPAAPVAPITPPPPITPPIGGPTDGLF